MSDSGRLDGTPGGQEGDERRERRQKAREKDHVSDGARAHTFLILFVTRAAEDHVFCQALSSLLKPKERGWWMQRPAA